MRVNIEQRTDEWLRWRQKGGEGNPYLAALGGSDAPVVMGVSPYKTRETLRAEKLFGVDITRVSEYYVNKGIDWEKVAPVHLGIDPFSGGPACFVSDERPWQIASVDWVDGDAYYEFKWTSKEIDESFEIPEHWYAQAQHIMDVVNADSITFGIAGDNGVIVKRTVLRDDEYIERLRREEEEFLASLEQGTLPIPADVSPEAINAQIVEQLAALLPSKIESISEAERARDVAAFAQKVLKVLEAEKSREEAEIKKKYSTILSGLDEIKSRFYELAMDFCKRGNVHVKIPGTAFYDVVEIDIYRPEDVPVEFMSVDTKKVRAAVKKDELSQDEWKEVIPGVRARIATKIKLS